MGLLALKTNPELFQVVSEADFIIEAEVARCPRIITH